ncbi:hypothetical protein UCRPC4_g02394 [Phaeomoniella chlamydospora]|uniref:Uncharacterized protein n=1 Tax=Phaeomoniella chlamydospora TaxID=158046 RepID=A0A0G2EQN2_PHACM|nr:hypothetical protein UCRPC4_g02394 [Phaeomoniella chlamydospora]
MKSVFRKAKPKKKTSQGTTGGQSQPSPVETSAVIPAAPEASSAPIQRRLDTRAIVQREKAQALFAKYGLELNDDEWYVSSVNPVQRVEKPIRMRCDHVKCKHCPRIPPKKNKGKRKGQTTSPESGSKDPERKEAIVTGKQSSTGGDGTERTSPKPKVRRSCHECKTFFEQKSNVCLNCKHTRCKLCPRDPPKTEKDGEADSEWEEDPKTETTPPEEKKETSTEPGLDKAHKDQISSLGIQGDEPGGSS